MSLRFAFYGRVSTEDAQDPEASRSWQKRRAIDLISPHGGVLAADYFDIGQSRSLPGNAGRRLHVCSQMSLLVAVASMPS